MQLRQRERNTQTIFSWSGAILFVHKYTAGRTSSGDKASKLQQKNHTGNYWCYRISSTYDEISCKREEWMEKASCTVKTNLLNILHSIDVAFIRPFSSSTKSKVRARCRYGAGCPSFQHAAQDSQYYSNSQVWGYVILAYIQEFNNYYHLTK